ncbi:MAG: phage baseplate assembly protein [Elusimicrobiales bacterium]
MTIIRAIITGITEGAARLFAATGRSGETFADRELLQHYGFASSPKDGAAGIVLVKDNQVFLVASDDARYRVALERGEVALYTDEGDRFHFKRGRKVELTAGVSVTVTAPQIVFNGDLRVAGDVSDGAGSMAAMRDKYNQHTHTDPQGGATGPAAPGM